MKKLVKLSYLLFIPFISGIVCIIAGIVTKLDIFFDIGIILMTIVMPLSMIACVVVGLVMMITGRLSDEPPDNVSKEKEYSEIADINTSYGYDSNMKRGEYLSRHTAENYANATLKEKILGWSFFAFLIGDFVLIFLFGVIGNVTGFAICSCIFAGTILISLIVKIILEKTSMSGKTAGRPVVAGEVKACVLSSMTSTGGSKLRYTTRIRGVTYRVTISVQGADFTAYSKTFYEKGEKVKIAVIGKRRAHIMNDTYSGD